VPTLSRDNSGASTSFRVEDALIKAARSLNSSLDLDSVCRAVLDAVEEIYGATSSWILLYDLHEAVLKTCAFRGESSVAYKDVALPPDVGILGLAFTSRRVVFVPDAQQDERWFDPGRVHRSGLRSVFTVPLLHKDGAMGVLGLDAPHFSAERPPDDDDIARLEALAAQAAIALTNARLFERTERDRRRLAALLEERRTLRRHMTHLQDEIREAYAFGEIIANSDAFKESLALARAVAPGATTALVLGETGTGKELLARFIHQHSDRKNGPFVAVNCAALPEALVESELFGHERGAFTGAIARKPGKFELAHRGTLFLDEIGDLPAEAQAKLLRVLQSSEVQRVGATSAISVDVRVIAATNHDLETAIGEKRFRSDLYYRLSVFPIRLPPLRERPDDVEPLARHFVGGFANKLRKPVVDIAGAALDKLHAYTWPGNVRELQNVIERAVILSTGASVSADAIVLDSHVPPSVAANDEQHEPVLTLAEAERRAILTALDVTRWRISGPDGAAERLGMRPTTLHAKMKRLGIRRPIPVSTHASRQNERS
jgi:formate hydrogenlyase transcriptional activator